MVQRGRPSWSIGKRSPSSARWLTRRADQGAAAEGRISRFRADTRAARIEIAEEAEARYGRKVSWGAQLGETRALFTHISVPVMTRLRQPERQVLDTLVDAGVARSRSEALSWAVKLVGEHAESWLADLRGRDGGGRQAPLDWPRLGGPPARTEPTYVRESEREQSSDVAISRPVRPVVA